MTNDELFPALIDKAPLDDDHAIARLGNLCAASGMLVSIVGSSYKDIQQLRRVLRECQYLVEHRILMNGGHVVTCRLSATHIHTGAKYELLVTEVGGRIATVNNCILRDPGAEPDEEAVQEYKDGLKRAKEDAAS